MRIYLFIIGLCFIAKVANAQSVITTDTVTICTGTSYKGIVFGKDSLLVVDTIGTFPLDTLRATQVQVLPVYLRIIDTTIVRGSYFMGNQILSNTSVNEFGKTYLGCDSNTTWVIYFKKEVTPPDYSRLEWKCSIAPNPVYNRPLKVTLQPQSMDQANDQSVTMQVFDNLGRVYFIDYKPFVKDWTQNSPSQYETEINTDHLTAGSYTLEIMLNQKVFGLRFLVFN
ncbi:MAG: hypothetical protein RIR11_341 [Bacteroidota bacterium]|jgi:hypothetical protein